MIRERETRTGSQCIRLAFVNCSRVILSSTVAYLSKIGNGQRRIESREEAEECDEVNGKRKWKGNRNEETTAGEISRNIETRNNRR